MSDEQATPETSDASPTPDTAAAAVAVAEAPAAPAAPPEPPPAPAPEAPASAAAAPTVVAQPVAAPAASPPAKRGAVQVPVWLLVLLGVVVIGVGAFFVGRETAPSTSGSAGPDTLAEAAEMTARGEMEVGDFDVTSLLDALRENDDFDLGVLEDLILDQIRGR